MYFMNFGVVAALAAALALVSLVATTFHGRASDVVRIQSCWYFSVMISLDCDLVWNWT